MIAVLIPCFNEAHTVADVIRGFQDALPGAIIYVYDNNSTDGTDEIAASCGAVVRYEYRQGKGNVIRRMFREIDAQCYILVDGDNTYPPEPVRDMVYEVLGKQVDMVVGDRLSSTYFDENKRPFHNFGNRVVRWGINHMFHSDIRDIMTGYRAFSYQFVKTFPVLSKGFEVETEMSIHAIDKNMRISNVPVTYRDRQEDSESKLDTYSDGVKVLLMMVRLYKNYKPFQFFGLLATVLATLSLAFFIPVFIEFMQTGLVDKFPTLFTCGFVMIAAVQSLYTGITLSSIREKDRQDFEMELLQVGYEFRKELKNEREVEKY